VVNEFKVKSKCFEKNLNLTLIRKEKNYIFISSCNYCVNVSTYILKNIHLATSELMVTFFVKEKICH
jgi:hypothetical protein